MTLTDAETAIIKSTIPILESGGVALTTHFYEIMFRDHQETLSVFNQTHQASGAQPRALANAVLMYARNIDKLESLGPLVSTIMNKHVALNINLEHYPVVGKCLLQAIREVLGAEIATDDVISAWAAAYGQLASLLSSAEQTVYDANEVAPGGWKGSRAFSIANKCDESSEITSFYLEPVDHKPILAFSAGRCIGLRLIIDDREYRRNYSLSSASDGTQYRISVKKETGGKVSTYLHEHAQKGDVLQLYPPAGDFVLIPNSLKPLVFVTAGVGITPVMAMIEEVLADGAVNRSVTFIHCAKNKAVQAFRDTLTEMQSKFDNVTYHSVYSQEVDSATNAHISVQILDELMPKDARGEIEAYFVGPKGFMVTVRKALLELGLQPSQIHWEFYGPAGSLDE